MAHNGSVNGNSHCEKDDLAAELGGILCTLEEEFSYAVLQQAQEVRDRLAAVTSLEDTINDDLFKKMGEWEKRRQSPIRKKGFSDNKR